MHLAGRLVVVSGASSGIGAATARECARRGAAGVALLARRQDRLNAVANDVRAAGAKAYVFPVDLAKADAVSAAVEAVRREAGDPHVLVNNAGQGRWLFTEDTSPDEALAMLAVPYLAAFWLTAGFLPAMLDRRLGHIVNLNSPAAFLPWPGATGYVSARWAMRGFTAALNAELNGSGVDVSQVVPGKVSSEYFASNPGSEDRIPGVARFNRTLSPDDVALLVAYAIERRRRLVVRPRLLQATVWFSRWFPGMVQALVQVTGAKRLAVRR